ncbi:MAG: XdhC/CoxI family protein [Planctomycetota bacterium]|nr:MAG: XdhC/CoxI family protein [Planctomycetota bacterium]
MLELLEALCESLRGGRPLVYCRLVETRGSTPQKAGAAMLVYEDASQVGTLGGGCVEAEVKRRALASLRRKLPEVARFDLDHDYGWDDGLICGGRMQVVIDPLVPEEAGEASLPDYFRQLHALMTQGQGGCEAIAFGVEAAASDGAAQPVAYLYNHEGSLLATRGPARDDFVPRLTALHERRRPYVEEDVSYLPIYPRYRLLIVGAGHVGKQVAELAVDLDFDVSVVDDRETLASAERFPGGIERLVGPVGELLPEFHVTPQTYCLIVTRGHSHDQEALYHLVDRGAAYVGMIGSRRKIRLIFDALAAEGIAVEKLAAVHAPVGIDIGSQTVPEIAVSIAAELIAHRNCAGDVPGRPTAVEPSAARATS